MGQNVSGERAGELLCLAAHWARARWAFTHLRGANLSAYQDKRARQIVRYANGNSPFYRAHWEVAGANLNDWRALPTVDKAAMMENFDGFNTRGICKNDAMETALQSEANRDFAPTLAGGVTVGLSSGTSGYRGLFLVSRKESAAWAGTLLARALPNGLPPKNYRIALFLRSNSNLYERLGVSRRIVFRWFDLMTPLDEAVHALNQFAPHLLVGPPSLLRRLASAKSMPHDALCIQPKRLLSVAEVLEPQDKAFLETAFDAPVGQIYQCMEGLLGVTCAYGSLHVQEDLVALQYEPLVNAANDTETARRVTPIVTDLWRTTQPIIRYRLNDVLRLAPETASPCPCGSAFQVIESVEGRCDDTCFFVSNATRTNSANTLRPFYPDTIRRIVLLADARITEYFAEQTRVGQLNLYLDVAGGAPFDEIARAVRKSAAQIVASYDCRAPELTITRGVPSVPPHTKRRRVVCHIAPSERGA